MACETENEENFFVFFKAQVRIVAAKYKITDVTARLAKNATPILSEPACQTAKPSNPASVKTANSHFVQSSFRIFSPDSSRSSRFGLMLRICKSGKTEKSREIKSPSKTPCQAAEK